MPLYIEEKIAALDAQIASKRQWLEDHGTHAKRPRPEWEIESKSEALKWLEAIASDYKLSLERENAKRKAQEVE